MHRTRPTFSFLNLQFRQPALDFLVTEWFGLPDVGNAALGLLWVLASSGIVSEIGKGLRMFYCVSQVMSMR